jgi:hypothetical protein
MRTNGTLQYQVLSPGGVDDNGEPIAPTETWSNAIDCSIKTNSDNRKGAYEDGEFRMASFIILLEEDAKQNFIGIKRIKLMRGAEALGEYRVICSEPLVTQGRFQIMV